MCFPKHSQFSILRDFKMSAVASILIILAVFSTGSFADPYCIFSIRNGRYSCDLYNANIQSESDELTFDGIHMTDYGNINVTSARVLLSVVKVLNNEILVKFPNLQRLEITLVQLERISDSAFGSCSELTEINIAKNPLSALQARVFANCQKLESIQIRSSLSDISPEAFHGLGNLVVLDLISNGFTSLPADVFEQTPNLTFIDLSWNKIAKFEPATFAPLVLLDQLILAGNPIHEIDATMFENLHALEWFDLRECGINSIHPDAFKNLVKVRILYMQYNNLQILGPGTFTSLESLQILDLQRNQIKRLNSNAFGHHPNATTLEIAHNGLDEVEQGFFNAFPNLRYINALNNTCVNYPISNMSTIPAEFAECYLNWITPRTSPLPTTPGAETTTRGSASVNIPSLLIAFATLYTFVNKKCC